MTDEQIKARWATVARTMLVLAKKMIKEGGFDVIFVCTPSKYEIYVTFISDGVEQSDTIKMRHISKSHSEDGRYWVDNFWLFTLRGSELKIEVPDFNMKIGEESPTFMRNVRALANFIIANLAPDIVV